MVGICLFQKSEMGGGKHSCDEQAGAKRCHIPSIRTTARIAEANYGDSCRKVYFSCLAAVTAHFESVNAVMEFLAARMHL